MDGQKCKVCMHPRRSEMEGEYLVAAEGGRQMPKGWWGKVERQYGVPVTKVKWHFGRGHHLENARDLEKAGCGLCRHPSRVHFEEEYIKRRNYADVARMSGVPYPVVRDHFQLGHADKGLVRGEVERVEGMEKARARRREHWEEVFEQELETLRLHIRDGITEAQARGKLRDLAAMIGQGHKNLEMVGRAAGILREGGGVSVGVDARGSGKVVLHYPVMTPEMLEAAKEAPVIDMPEGMKPRSLLR